MDADQTGRPRALLGWRVLALLLIVLGVYVVFAEWLDLHPMGPPLPEDRVENRVVECILLWTAACWVYGWLCVVNGRGRGRAVPMLRFAMVPIVASLVIAGYNLRQRALAHAPTGPGASQLAVLGIVLALSPIVYGVTGSLLLYLHVRRWRRMCRTGVCERCEYDLTGNVSGVCPECGRSTSESDRQPRRDPQHRKLGGLLMMSFGLLLALFAVAGGPVLRYVDADQGYSGQQVAWAVIGVFLAAVGMGVRRGRA